MAEQRQSAMQRIQVGLVGLVIVLLFVSLANMVLDRVNDGTSVTSTANGQPVAVESEQLPDEPLAELGVTPVAKDEEEAKALEAPTQNIRQVAPSTPAQ
jgi:antitoxin (DNA-binding transcriptional repressor) of toxin-antitoxin stability system